MIGFAESSTTVSESGNAVLFVVIVDGTIPPGEQYIVTLTTRDGTADGKRSLIVCQNSWEGRTCVCARNTFNTHLV